MVYCCRAICHNHVGASSVQLLILVSFASSLWQHFFYTGDELQSQGRESTCMYFTLEQHNLHERQVRSHRQRLMLTTVTELKLKQYDLYIIYYLPATLVIKRGIPQRWREIPGLTT